MANRDYLQTKNPRYFAGYKDGTFTIFRARSMPLQATHGDRYGFVYGAYQSRKETLAVLANHQWARVIGCRGEIIREPNPYFVA